MSKLVTIGLPVFQRLDYLASALRMVAEQDYANIELIVSDNGNNGSLVREMVEAHYTRPFRFRQNPATVPVSTHLNQIIREATGEYFILYMDDDEISPNFVSALVRRYENTPAAAIALGRQESIDEKGTTIRKSTEPLPEAMEGSEFVEAVWHRYSLGLDIVATYLARTEEISACGGYPDFSRGNHIDNALTIKLCLGRRVVFAPECTFRWRLHEASHGWSGSLRGFADSTREFIGFVNHDPFLRNFYSTNPSEGAQVRDLLVRMAWSSYLWRWRELYQGTMPPLQWAGAAFAMPWIPEYYRGVYDILMERARRTVKRCLARNNAS
jgi:glycosyltransferase involved in cell wall biosynthesis